MADTVLIEQRGDVLVLTLNRPDRLNAWTPQMAAELAAGIEQANASPDVGAVVMTGAGRGFCAGADIEDTFATRLSGRDPGADTAGGQGGMPASVDWVGLCARSKPLIAAVNGACVGIGFIKVGLVPEVASIRMLPERMGPGRARMFAFSGDLWPADEALAAGLVDKVVGAEELMGEAVGLAGRIAAN